MKGYIIITRYSCCYGPSIGRHQRTCHWIPSWVTSC